jgi:putative membrane protein
LALILIGAAIVVVSLIRFVRTSRMIDDQQWHSAQGIRAELVLSVVLTLIVTTMVAFFALY